MFGEIPMVGTVTHNIDEKGRIALPKKMTRVEYKDDLVLCEDFRIYPLQYINEEIQLIKNNPNLSLSKKEKLIQEIFDELQVTKILEVDKAGRIGVGRDILKSSERQVDIEGRGTCIQLKFRPKQK